MKTLLFILFPLLLMGQNLDVSDVKFDTDSTFTTRPDTAYWQFQTGVAKFTRPNGSNKDIPMYEAKLIVWQGGKRTTPITSGILQKKEYLEFIRQYRDQHNSEVEIIVKALDGVRARRDALKAEIDNVTK